MADADNAQRGGYGPQKNNIDRIDPTNEDRRKPNNEVAAANEGRSMQRQGRTSSTVSTKDLKAAISLINSFVSDEAAKNSNEELRDAAEHIRRTGRKLFAIAKAIDEALDERV